MFKSLCYLIFHYIPSTILSSSSKINETIISRGIVLKHFNNFVQYTKVVHPFLRLLMKFWLFFFDHNI